jgi:hypothetical protein
VLRVEHVELKDANEFVAKQHRHHKPVIGHRFSVGVSNGVKLVGVAIVGRPVARGCNLHNTVEVTRLCTDGTKNACSFLYSVCARVARELGYKKIQTYILASEPGTSLLASGWKRIADVVGRQWTGTNGKTRRTDQPTCDKHRYEKDL